MARPGDQTRSPHDQDELSAGVVRALAGADDVQLRGGLWFRGRGQLPVYAPHVFPLPHDNPASFRGAADGVALRLTGSDHALYRRVCPEDAAARLVFELLEQFRVESLAPRTMPGVSKNLRRRHELWSLTVHHSGLTATERGLVLYTVAQICRSRITGEPVIAETEDLIEATRGAVAKTLGADLRALRRHRGDQAAFAIHARRLAEAVAAMVTAPSSRAVARPDTDNSLLLLASLPDLSGQAGQDRSESSAGSATTVPRPPGYQVFTSGYDEERRIATLARPAELTDYRERLDARIACQGVSVMRLVRELATVLATPAPGRWEGGHEEGHIDGRRLAQLIASPAERALFRVRRNEQAADVLLTFLVDCSGSMAQHRETLAVITDVFARALDICGASCEILGFTTSTWNGGQCLRDWQRAGRPRNPGRLNERRHLVFKDAATPWRQARRDIAGLLKADLFREGMDGEAVSWAAGRASSQTARRRLLVVLSDGSPMDRATALANGEQYLDEHLTDVVAGLEDSADVEIYGLGFGLDLRPYYRYRLLAGDLEGTGYRVFREITRLFAQPGH